jgi:septum formation protein
MGTPILWLASASPRRLELLRRLGLEPCPAPAGLDEDGRPGEGPEAHVRRLAAAKGRHVRERLIGQGQAGVVLAADTVVALEGFLLGKPGDAREAEAMLRRLAGRDHDVWTGVWAGRLDDPREALAVERTRVRFRSYDDRLVKWYVSTGEPLDKAGGYGIQERGGLLTERIEGSWSNVVGLPVERLPGLFRALGLDLLDLIRPA